MNEQGSLTWKPVFIALTDKDVLLYDTAPWSKEEWATPFQSHPLLATRYSIHCTYSTEHDYKDVDSQTRLQRSARCETNLMCYERNFLKYLIQ